VSNPNDPDAGRALATGGDVRSLVGGAFGNWYYSMQGEGPSTTTGTMADHYTASWGNWGMRTYSGEPRVEFNNSSTERSDILQVVEGPWYNNYGAIVSANLAIRAIAGGLDIDPDDPSQTPMVKAAATFLQGAAHSNIALFFDKGYVVDENTDPTTLTFSTRTEIRDAALVKLDAAIALAGASAFQLPDAFLNITGWTNVQLAQVANTIAARTIAYFGRTPTENDAADWARVLQYASQGISSGVGFDAAIVGDGGINWYDPYKTYMEDWTTWARVDMRVVCLMDPAQPCRHPDNTNEIGRPNSPDFRMSGGGDTTLADFNWHPAAEIPHNPARGLFHFSEVGHQRYFATSVGVLNCCTGTLPFILRAENDLLWAEALVRTGGDKALAAQKINNSRVVRGQLPALTGAESDPALLDAIFYEREIELFGSAGNVPYYDMRRTDRPNGAPPGTGLQALTLRHFPVPARELQVLGLQIYTFGGTSPEFSPPVGGGSGRHSTFGQIGGRTIVGPGAVVQIANDMVRAGLRAVRSNRQY
jgi:hypothetical protein